MKVPASAAPMCKLCGARHSFAEPHVYPDHAVTKSVTPVTSSVTKTEKVTVDVMRVTTPVTAYIPTEAEMINAAVSDSHECPICGLVHHRPATNAERQRAYRERHATP